jgi:F-type H+-transporting ATPase subunit b
MSIRLATALLIRLALVAWCAAAAMPLAAAEHAEPSPAGHAPELPADPAPAQGGSGQAKIRINPIDFKKDLAIWTAVVFVVLMAVLWLIAWRPIVEGLHRREQRIAQEIASAERSNEEARELLDEYRQKLAASGQEVQEMLQAARRDAEKVGQEIVEKARADAEADQRRRLEEIEAAAADAIKELGEQGATLAVELAGKIVAAKLDPKDHSQLIEQAVTKFSTKKPDAD